MPSDSPLVRVRASLLDGGSATVGESLRGARALAEFNRRLPRAGAPFPSTRVRVAEKRWLADVAAAGPDDVPSPPPELAGEGRRAPILPETAHADLAVQIAALQGPAAGLADAGLAQLDALFQQTRFEGRVGGVLAAGAACALTGLAAGAAAGAPIVGVGAVVGGVVGAVVGFIGGVANALIPRAQWDLYENWRLTCNALTVEERFGCLVAFRPMCQHVRELERRTILPPFRLIDSGVFGTRGGADNDLYVMFQALYERDCWPEGGPARIAHAVAAASAELEQDEPLWHAHEWKQVCDAGLGSRWLLPHLRAAADKTAAQVRAEAVALGVTDIGHEEG